MSVIDTERLIIRRFTIQDAEFVRELFNTPAWLEFIGNKNVRTVHDASKYIRDTLISSYQKQGFGFYVVELKNDHIPIGLCGLVKRDHLDDADIGFGFLPQHTGKGYAFEASSACLDYAKNNLNLERIIAVTTEENLHSRNLITRLGLNFEKMINWPESNKEIMLFSKILSQNTP